MKKFVAVSLMVMMVWVSPQGLAHSGPPVPTPVGLAEIAVAFEWDFDATEITAERISDQLYVLFGAGGNIAVSVGAQGVLVVDDQFPALADKIRAAIKNLGGNQVDFAVNTHWHFDHADGHQFLGPDGAWIVAQANSRAKMTQDQVINLVSIAYDQKAYPPAGDDF